MSAWICRIIPFFNTNHYLHKFPNFAANSFGYFSTSTPKISIFDYLVNHHNFSPQCASNVSSSLSSNFINNPQNADSVLNFLKESGFSKNQIEALVQKSPNVLSCKLETTIKPKIKVFQDSGFHSTDFADTISANPWLLRSSADRLRLSILGLKNLGPNANICRLLKNFGTGEFLTYDWDKAFVPNIEYLKSCGICSLKIASYVCRYPKFFLNKTERLEGFVERVDEMGVDRNSKMFLEAVRVISSVSRENWELKLKVFRDLGFSDQNILRAFRVCPTVFGSSEKKIKEVTQLLLSVDDFSIYGIVCNPVLLSYSVEKRLKPRLQVLKALQSKNFLKKSPGLVSFCQMSNTNFRNKYVIPYSDEVGDLYVATQGS